MRAYAAGGSALPSGGSDVVHDASSNVAPHNPALASIGRATRSTAQMTHHLRTILAQIRHFLRYENRIQDCNQTLTHHGAGFSQAR